MFDLKYEENDNLINSLNLESSQRLVLRYIVVYGNCSTTLITESKKIDSLSIFDYLKPNEYQLFKQNIKEPTTKEKDIIKKFYIGTKYSWIINSKLRCNQELLNDEKKVYDILNDICDKNRCGKNCILKRYVDLNFLSQYNITFDKFNEQSARDALNLIKTKLIYNVERKEKGFMSASYGKNAFSDREILLLLYCPFGIRMYVTDNDAETEVIFKNNMKYIFFDSYLEKVNYEGLIFYRIVICCFLMGNDNY